MAAQFTIIAGPPNSGKTQRLLARYRSVLIGSGEGDPEKPAGTFSPIGQVLWLAPTWRAAADIRARLLCAPLGACFSPGVMTFERFARAVLEAVPEAVRPASRSMKRQLVRRLIDDHLSQGRLKYFRPIATAGGLVDLVCDFISELKRLEIWPEHFRQACSARGMSEKDIALLELYEAYQQCLQGRQLYDAEGCLWSARDWLGKPWPQAPAAVRMRFWERLRLVVADGFTDFTRTQHEILELLAARAEQMLISLPLEAEPRRADLFSKPLRTLAELQRRHGRVVVEELDRPERADWPALAHLEKNLFGNPRQARPAEDTGGIEILAAARPQGEMELIGSRIKRLLATGEAKADEVAVVFRWPQDSCSLLAEVFGGLGIPVALEMGQTLDRLPALRALAALLRLEVEDWPCGALLAVLGNNYFQPDWREWHDGRAAAAAEQAVRGLQIPRGRQRLLEQLSLSLWVRAGVRGAEVGTDLNETPTRPHPNPLPKGEGAKQADSSPAAIALSLLHRLAAELDQLPQQATLSQWAAAWQQLAQQTGLLRVVEQRLPPGMQTGLSDRAAWDRLQAILAEVNTLDKWLAWRAAELDRRQALAVLTDILSSETVGFGGDETGRVRVLSAASIRRLRVPYLFLAGLSEKAFPPPEREDRFYSDAEYQRLIAEGLPLVARSERNNDEMLLFYEAVTRATKRLYLSYPALDESAQPLSPSPYLKEVEQACGPGRIARTKLTNLSPIPTDEEPLSQCEFRIRAVATALEGDVSLLAGLLQRDLHDGAPLRSAAVSAASCAGSAAVSAATQRVPGGQDARAPASGAADNLLAGLQLIYLRQDRERFGPAEGVLQSEAVGQRLSACFDSDRTFAATELESYASCPFRFYLERVLRLRPLEELTLAVDLLERGQLAHDALAEFHRRVNAALGRPGSPAKLPEAQYQRLLSEALAAVLPTESHNPVRAALREVDRRLLLRWLADYRRQSERYDALWQDCDAPLVPEFFEVSFGRSLAGEPRSSTEEPLEITDGDQVLRIAGRIDRIDTGRVAGHTVFNVLDYKTGGSTRFSPEAVAAGTALQLPLYALAAAELLLNDRDAIPWQAGYWYVADDGFKPKQSLKMYRQNGNALEPEPVWEQIRQGLAVTVLSLVRAIRQGRFAVSSCDPRCTGYCPFHTVCRINQVRSLEKTWIPTAGND